MNADHAINGHPLTSHIANVVSEDQIMLSPDDSSNINASQRAGGLNSNCSNNLHHKRKSTEFGQSFFGRLFGPKLKRARTTAEREGSNGNKMADSKTAAGASSKAKDCKNAKKDAQKPSLDKSRRKEVKSRLNAEASKDIRPLAIGTLAMMGSALSNQGKLCGILFES